MALKSNFASEKIFRNATALRRWTTVVESRKE